MLRSFLLTSSLIDVQFMPAYVRIHDFLLREAYNYEHLVNLRVYL